MIDATEHRDLRHRYRTRGSIEELETEPAPRLELVGDRGDLVRLRKRARELVGLADLDRAAGSVGDVDRAEVDGAHLGRVVVEQPHEPERRLEVGDELLAAIPGATRRARRRHPG